MIIDCSKGMGLSQSGFNSFRFSAQNAARDELTVFGAMKKGEFGTAEKLHIQWFLR